MNCLLVLALVGYVAASSPSAYRSTYAYHGKYPGKCGYDGLYYRDSKSFVFCTNGNSYVQPCAPGTRNSAYEKYSSGAYYSHRDFCDVNLVDYSYGAPKYVPVKDKYQPKRYAEPERGYYAPQPYGRYQSTYAYHGKYPGKCGYDGLYYRDSKSFVICSNGNSYVQPCAPGTKNSAYEKYSYGEKYSYRDFCDVNLVDYSNPAPKYEPKKDDYEPKKDDYEEPKEESYSPQSYGYKATHFYHGKYPGKCGYDGLYYRDSKSFIICSNGNSYVQPCAKGTKNSAFKKYSYGQKYSYRDFCDVNLNDYASPLPSYKPRKVAYKPIKKDYAPQPYGYKSTYAYHGKYPGKCSYDGLYYRDSKSFIFCSNGNSYVQPCAPGTKNSAYEKYSYGEKYSYRDFCDVNLNVAYPVHAPAPSYEPKKVYAEPKKDDYAPAAYTSKSTYAYHGKYPGKCGYDGLYYRDAKSFVICSNGNSYVQPCAPGTKNSAYEKYSYGEKYSYRDFCDVNLVDYSYPAPKYEPKKDDYEPKKDDYEEPKEESYDPQPYGYSSAYAYHGKYPGKCGKDGLYFRDSKSFVFCSNGNSYVQPCAPGTRNSPYEKYSYGQKYSYRDFCDVNLVDYAYPAKGDYAPRGNYYDRPSSRYGVYPRAYGYRGAPRHYRAYERDDDSY